MMEIWYPFFLAARLRSGSAPADLASSIPGEDLGRFLGQVTREKGGSGELSPEVRDEVWRIWLDRDFQDRLHAIVLETVFAPMAPPERDGEAPCKQRAVESWSGRPARLGARLHPGTRRSRIVGILRRWVSCGPLPDSVGTESQLRIGGKVASRRARIEGGD